MSVGAIVDKEALGYRVWEGPLIPVSVFAGTGTITRPWLFKVIRTSPINRTRNELWLELQAKYRVMVSLSTIWRTLKKGDYSMKKVHYLSIMLQVQYWVS